MSDVVLPEPGEPVLRRLATERLAWLCTLRPDGSPHLTPVWFLHAVGELWVGTSESLVKVRNVSRDPRVSVALPDGDAPVVAEGSVRILRSDFPAQVVDGFREKYGWTVTDLGSDGRSPVLLQISVTRWLMTGTAR